MEKRLAIIGGGPAGLAAALAAKEAGVNKEDILIIERDNDLGGILNQCIHAGFGLHMFGEELTGPEYAGRFIEQVKNEGIPFVTDSMVLSVSGAQQDGRKVVTFVSPTYGFVKLRAEAVVLAMGCRERTRGALNIAGSRPAGVYTAGTAQRFVNMEGYMPGKRVVILGSGDIGLIMARRMTLEGAKVLRVCELMPYSGGLARNITQCLNDFGIPLYLSHTVTKIHGKDRVEGVTVAEVGPDRKPVAGTEEYVECDTLLLSVGLIPENELSKGAGVTLDRITGGAVVNQFCETSVEGVFACGNVLQVHDLVDFVTEEAYNAGKNAAKYLLQGLEKGETGTEVRGERGVRYVVPQLLCGSPEKGTKLFFRVDNNYKNVLVTVEADGKLIKEIKKRSVSPGEMENIVLDEATANAIGSAEQLVVALKKVEA